MNDDAPCTFAPHAHIAAWAEDHKVPLTHDLWAVNLLRSILEEPPFVMIGPRPTLPAMEARMERQRAALGLLREAV